MKVDFQLQITNALGVCNIKLRGIQRRLSALKKRLPFSTLIILSENFDLTNP